MIRQDTEPRPLPFRIDRSSRRNLSEQVAVGLREAICTGYFREGDVLPRLDDMARQLGVSMRVPREAVDALKREGLVNPRPGLGCAVMAPCDIVWKGRVLMVCSDADEASYYTGALTGALRRRLAEHGYLLSCVAGMEKSSGQTDYSLLGPALARRFDFAFVFGHWPEVFRRLSKAAIPFVSTGNVPAGRMPHFVGRVPYDYSAAFERLVEDCLERGVKTAEQFDFERSRTVDATGSFHRAGISMKSVIIAPKREYGWLEGIMRAASEFFRARIAAGKPWPDLLFFADDFVAFGALPALEASGIRIPEDVKIATCSHRGFEPVFPIPLARICTDPREHGDTLARYAVSYLNHRCVPAGAALRPEYVPGETLSGPGHAVRRNLTQKQKGEKR